MRWVTELTYSSLVRLARPPSELGAVLWDRAWNAAWRRLSGPVRTSVHGHPVIVNAGYPYPAFIRRWPTYNGPLTELVHEAHLAKGSPVGLVDVGAAVGDTVLLVLDRCPGEVGTVHCVEGDGEFFGYLRHNLGRFPQVQLHQALLSDEAQAEAELVRTHRGTASAQGPRLSPAVTLDSLAEQWTSPVDVLKIDTDGFDGKVLAGATRVLRDQQPAVIFEWHPRLYAATGQDHHRPFEILVEAGYRWLVWFDKYGAFSHVDDRYQAADVEVLGELCTSDRARDPDWHYDVIALPGASPLQPARLAALDHARRRPPGPGEGARRRGRQP